MKKKASKQANFTFKRLFLGISIVVLGVCVFSLAACDGGATSMGGGGETETGLAVYSGKHSTNDLTLTITEKKTGKAVYDPKNGDSFKMLVGDKLSSGSVTDVAKTETTLTFTLKPSKGDTFTVTITISTRKISNVTGTVTFDSEGDAPWAGPGNVNNGSTGGGGGGGGGGSRGGSSGGGGNTTPGSVAVTGVSLNKTSVALLVGGMEALTATIAPSNAANQNLTWSSSNTAVANVSASGVVTAVAPGSATITVKTVDGNKTATCAVTVNPIPVSGVTLKASTSLLVGGTETLDADINPPNATNKNVAWSTNNDSVATVSASGVVTGVSAGTATITVKTADGNKTATCSVNVVTNAVAVTGVSLNKSFFSLEVGGMENLDATITPSAATNQNVTWSSSNTSVATVLASGVVTALAPGSATITVKTVDGNKTATCAVTVNSILVSSVSLKSSTSIEVGGEELLSYIIEPLNATNKNVTWSSSNTAVANVSASGVVTPVAPGTAIITVTTVDGSKTASCTVTVNASVVAVTGVSLNKSSTSLTVGGTETLIATIAPANATNKNVTWSSSNTYVATVNNGTVTAVAPGTTTITVKTVDGDKTASCNVNIPVPNPPFTSVAAFKAWLDTKPPNASNAPYTVALNLNSLEGLNTVLLYAQDKYVNLDFSGSTFTSIGRGAFQDFTHLTSVTIPSSVTSIEWGAFLHCFSLASVTIGSGVISIGERAFQDCTSLTSITIPDSVTSIGYMAFSGCAIASVTIGNSVTSIGEVAFYECTSLTSVTIGNSVTSIGNGAFNSCTSLASVTIPSSVTSIGDGAFSRCTSLTSVTIGNSVTSIGNGAFNSCTSLTSVIIPSSVTSIGGWAFYECTSLTSVTFQGSASDVSSYMFPGDLDSKYWAGGIGTYTRPNGSSEIWTKTGSSITKPATPSNVSASAASSSSITVSWSSVTGATGYKVYRSTSSSGTYSSVGDVPTTSYTNTGLTAGTTYYYKVSAYNSAGESAQSSYASATPSSNAVIFNSVTANGSSAQTTTQLTLTFSQAISGLSASDITLSGVSGISKGTLSGSGPTYTLPISGFTASGTLTVAVAKSGYTISASPKTVPIFAAGQGISQGIFEYYWVNTHGNLVTTSGNAVTVAAGTTLTITAQSPGYTVRQWHLNGENTGQNGDTYTFSSTKAGKYTVGLFVEKDGKLYNTNITITVQ